MDVVFSGAAREDLREIMRYIAPHDLTAAFGVVDEINAFCTGLLSKHPLIGKPLQDEVRVAYKRGYRIYHKVGEDEISILRIIHMARDDYEI